MPLHQHGSRVTWFEVTKRRAAGGPYKEFAKIACTEQTKREATLKELEAGEGFRFKVRAKNSVGFSEWSIESRVLRTNTGARLSSRTDREIRLQWIAPFIGRSRYVGDYDIQKRRVLSRKEKAKLLHLEATKCISTLTNEERGMWVNALVGKESWINKKKMMSTKEEEEEEEEKKDSTSSDIEDEDMGIKTPQYLLDAYKDAESNGLMSSLSPPECSLLDLLPNQRYDFRLRAQNVPVGHTKTEWGDAIESPSISTEVGVPEPPAGLEVSLRTHDSVFVTWKAPHDNGLPVEGYRFVVITEDAWNNSKVTTNNKEQEEKTRTVVVSETKQGSSSSSSKSSSSSSSSSSCSKGGGVSELCIMVDIDLSGLPPTSCGMEKILIKGQIYIGVVAAQNEWYVHTILHYYCTTTFNTKTTDPSFLLFLSWFPFLTVVGVHHHRTYVLLPVQYMHHLHHGQKKK